MSAIIDYLSNYYQTVQRYLDSVNVQIIEQGVNTAISFIRDYDHSASELLDFYDKSKLLGQEAYKYDVYENAHNALSFDKWTNDLIGKGEISERVIEAISYADNLVNRRYGVPEFLSKLKTRDKQELFVYERALYNIYCGENEEQAFDDAIQKNCFSAKYPLNAFLWFIKDQNRFLPTSPEHFEAIFSDIGFPFRMIKRCNWKNYCEFIAIVSCVQKILSKQGVCSHEVSLLDAHSILWIMNYPEFKKWHNETNSINTPMKPKNRIRKPNGNIYYVCARCMTTFVKSPRCPECGQLIKL